MAELGYQRNPKKCKEKFENVYKYHKRTKEGRSSKPDGKTYRFFDQLQALEHNPPPLLAPPPMATTTAMAVVLPPPTIAALVSPVNTAPQGTNNPMNFSFQPSSQPPTMHTTNPPQTHNFQPSRPNISTSHLWISTSSSTSSDEDIQRRHKRKRKWMDYFERLMKDVIEKQEELQKKFLETLEKREKDRIAREEAWRVQEMAKMSKEHELLVQERSIAAAKDSALRTDLDLKYQENGPKGPLWEEISAAMAKIGYNRSSKRCKEKWENINKYFKKVKESNKKRPEDSKTCPYFEQLDALYKEKAKNESSLINSGYTIPKPENPMVPLMYKIVDMTRWDDE
ncbi:Trihelix transcription factor GT-2 [Forsythia ovata]|uniref:Trihelix transcription factor GT-2 n=1 Tax=Forsythia ovata TaxID=205694 RepID=A0ABD1U4H0_9LAMI